MQALDAITASGASPYVDPMLEKVDQCPEAFAAGEMIGKVLDTLTNGESPTEDRLLPPSGIVMPLV